MTIGTAETGAKIEVPYEDMHLVDHKALLGEIKWRSEAITKLSDEDETRRHRLLIAECHAELDRRRKG